MEADHVPFDTRLPVARCRYAVVLGAHEHGAAPGRSRTGSMAHRVAWFTGWLTEAPGNVNKRGEGWEWSERGGAPGAQRRPGNGR